MTNSTIPSFDKSAISVVLNWKKKTELYPMHFDAEEAAVLI
jgi:hypothetical protein